MILTVDSSALALMINPNTKPPHDPSTGKPVSNAAARIELFLKSLSPTDIVIVPTPVLAEILVVADLAGPELLSTIGKSARIRTKPFGERAAIETAAMTQEALRSGGKKAGSGEPWQKVKIDRQVIAVARAENSTRLYADDRGLVYFARLLGMEVFSTWDLPEPPKPEPSLLDIFDADHVALGASLQQTASD